MSESTTSPIQKSKLMMTFNQSWYAPMAATRKFLARELMYGLSRKIDGSQFDVVSEGEFDLYCRSVDQADVIIYHKKNNLIPVVAINICLSNEIEMISVRAAEYRKKYGLKEFFIYNLDDDTWHVLNESSEKFTDGSYSQFLQLNLPVSFFALSGTHSGIPVN